MQVRRVGHPREKNPERSEEIRAAEICRVQRGPLPWSGEQIPSHTDP